MKLVLCGEYRDFSRFINILRGKGKAINDYEYISRCDDLRGYSRDTKIVKLGSFSRNRYREEIVTVVLQNFDLTERQTIGFRGFQSGGIVSAFQGGGTLTLSDRSYVDVEALRGSFYSNVYYDESAYIPIITGLGSDD